MATDEKYRMALYRVNTAVGCNVGALQVEVLKTNENIYEINSIHKILNYLLKWDANKILNRVEWNHGATSSIPAKDL